MKPQLEVCLSPQLFKLLPEKWDRIIIIDVLRASTTICSALESGAASVIPVATVEAAKTYEAVQYVKAAERNGQTHPDFQFGNSPLFYQSFDWQKRSLVLTTTNGTRCLEMAKEQGEEILVGAFSNLTAVIDHLIAMPKNTLLFCAGWQGRFSMEDTLFAGAVTQSLAAQYELASDAALAAQCLYQSAETDLLGTIKKSSHYQRLANKGLAADIEFCMQKDTSSILPILRASELLAQ